jgi:hypothetical protein
MCLSDEKLLVFEKSKKFLLKPQICSLKEQKKENKKIKILYLDRKHL